MLRGCWEQLFVLFNRCLPSAYRAVLGLPRYSGGRHRARPKGTIQRRLHKAILRYHDPANWGIIREALTKMGLARKLIGSKPGCLVPHETRGEKDQQHHKKNGKGKNNAKGNKTTFGKKPVNGKSGYGKKPTSKSTGDKSKQGLTRFSENQFDDRKPKKPFGRKKK